MSDVPEKGGVIETDDPLADVDGNDTQEDIDETAKKIAMEHPKKPIPLTKPTFGDASHVEVDRTNLEAILDVSNLLKGKRSKKSSSILTLATESYKDKQVNKFQLLIQRIYLHLFNLSIRTNV